MKIKDKISIIDRKILADKRGTFFKVLNGYEKDLSPNVGEFYITTAYPDEAKGGHYHIEAREWFTLIKGKCILKLVDLETKEELSLSLDMENPRTIYVPPMIAHIFINNGQEDFILTAYSDQLYKPEDTVPYTFEAGTMKAG